jgi:hypothetical protein
MSQKSPAPEKRCGRSGKVFAEAPHSKGLGSLLKAFFQIVRKKVAIFFAK